MAIDTSLIQGTISGLKLAGDIAKSIIKFKSISEVQGKVIELQNAILSAQSSALSAQAHQAAMIEEIRNLEKEIARIKAWEEQKQRYKLVPAWEGAVLYALKKSCSNSEPPHWICTNCYEDGRKSILNPRWDRFYTLCCPTCKSEFQSNSTTRPPKPEYVTE